MTTSTQKPNRHRLFATVSLAVAGLLTASLAVVSASGASIGFGSQPPSPVSCPTGATLQVPTQGGSAECVITSTGTPVGGVKHVWLIIEENKSYDSTFTGLNQNSYLWQTLPQQGALLTN